MPWWAYMLLPFLAVLAAALLAAPKRRSRAEIKGAEGERRVAAELARMGVPALHDIYLPSRHGTTQVDHVARVGNAIVVIETKNYSGSIYGSATDRRWRQSFGRGRGMSFMNPLHQNGGHVSAVRKALGGVEADVRGIVVMAGDARFPNGRPGGVIHVDDLAGWIRRTFVEAGAVTAAEGHWRRLSERAAATDRRAARKAHRETLDRRVGGRKPLRPADRIDPTF